MYFEQGDLDKAIKDYSKGIILDPNSIGNYHNRANAYRAKAQKDIDKVNELSEMIKKKLNIEDSKENDNGE